jgi:small subunit ribosomal protein S16
MALKIRLRQQGRNNRPFFRLVVANVRSPRDGKFIEVLGWYNPFETEQDKLVSIKPDRLQHWLKQGAQLSEAAALLFKHVAPQVLADHNAKIESKKVKMAAKRRARRQAKAKVQKAAAPKSA